MNINEGLILPFRFYDSLEKQSRYRGCGRYENAGEIRHNEYLISYGCRILPFQIVRLPNPSTTTNLSIVSICDDTETDITSYLDSDDWVIETIGGNDYITYLGRNDVLNGANCVLSEGVYYAKFSDGTDTWYSELFQIKGVEETIDNDIRIWSTARGAIRIWEDNDDIRITN